MEHAPDRQFLGWDKPFIECAVPRFIALVRERGIDPAQCVLVLPGRRAARRVEERIAELAPLDWPPPRVITESALAGELSSERLVFASAWDRALAWREAMRASSLIERVKLWSSAPNVMPVNGLARVCARTSAQLSAEGTSAAQVVALARRDASLGDVERWQALESAEARYFAGLARIGRIDPARAALHVAGSGALRVDVHIFLCALVDLTQAQRALLAHFGSRVTSLVFAPAALAAGFDAQGALVESFWAERNIDIDRAHWRVVDTPDEQARVALERLAELAPHARPEQVSIGVPDADVLPYVERRLLQAGCEPRWAGGSPLANTRPALVIQAVLAWLAERRFEDFAALVRHPDLARAIGSELALDPDAPAVDLDAYAADHVPARIDGAWLEDEGERHNAQRLERVYATLLQMLGPLATTESRTSAAWADALATLLARVWPEVDLGARERTAWLHARAFEALAVIVAELRDADSAVLLDAREALELIVERIEATDLPPAPPQGDKPVIELFGALELTLDDAAELVVTGFNEGALPVPSATDPLLYEAARCKLQLDHEARRVARDTWALSAVLASRPATMLVTGRRSSRRDPRTPSRLLFRCDASEAVARVLQVWPEHKGEAALLRTARSEHQLPFVAAPTPTRMSVTSFKRYIDSPYLFYLQNVLRLRTVDDAALELDGMGFGSLAHHVLQVLGGSALTVSTSESALRELLCNELDRLAARRFGPRARAAVRLQVERLRARLHSFARWQARQPAAGWIVKHVEHQVAGVELDGMVLTGRIDRIDVSVDGKQWRVIDYKTGDSGESPKRAHGKPGAWKDLQLPLYRYMVESLAPPGASISVGYVTLGKQERDELFEELELDERSYVDAMARAREIVASVRAGAFDDVGLTKPREEIFAALCGYGLVETDDEELPE